MKKKNWIFQIKLIHILAAERILMIYTLGFIFKTMTSIFKQKET